MKIEEQARVEIQQILGYPLPDPSSPGFAAFYSRLETEQPELATRLAAALQDDAPLEEMQAQALFPEQEAQAHTRAQARSVLHRLFYRQDPLTDEWQLSKGKVGFAGLGAFALLMAPLLLATPAGGQGSKPVSAAPTPKAAAPVAEPVTAPVTAPPPDRPPPPPQVAQVAPPPDSPPTAPLPEVPAPVAYAPPPVPPDPQPLPPPQPPPVQPPAEPPPPLPGGGTLYASRRPPLTSSTVYARQVPTGDRQTTALFTKDNVDRGEGGAAPAMQLYQNAPDGPMQMYHDGSQRGPAPASDAPSASPAPEGSPPTPPSATPPAAPAAPGAPAPTPAAPQPAAAPPAPPAAALSPLQAAGLGTGAMVPAQLLTGIVVTQGSAPVPVLAQTGSGVVLAGTATLNAAGRMEVTFREAVIRGQGLSIRAQAFDPSGLPGVVVQARDVAPALAADLTRAAASGVATYVRQLSEQGRVTAPTGVTINTGPATPVGTTILGAVAELFSVPPSQKALVRVAQVDRGTPLIVGVVGGASGSGETDQP